MNLVHPVSLNDRQNNTLILHWKNSIYMSNSYHTFRQGVALIGRNRNGLSCSVDRPTAHAPGSVTDDHSQRQQTTDTTSKTILAH